MSDFKTRLKEEKTELQAKIDRLDNFIVSENFYKIDYNQQILLKIQLSAMNTYLECLKQRLGLFIEPSVM